MFGTLTREELSKILPLCTTLEYREADLVYAQGREATRVYVITRGQIALQKGIRAPNRRRSRRATLEVCGPGETVGWCALVEPYKYTLSAVAWESSTLIGIDAKMLRKALGMYAEIGYKVMCALVEAMARRLIRITDSLTDERM